MATAGISAKNLSDAEHSVQLRRAVVASTVGSVIESYDFLLYVLIAPLVFAKLYFPSSDPLVGTLQAFGIYAVGFISRPLGAAFFGHYGDRIGRKVTLIATLLIRYCLGKTVCPGSARNIKLFSASARGPVLGAVSQRSDARSEFSSSLGTDPFRQHNGRPGVRGRTSHRS